MALRPLPPLPQEPQTQVPSPTPVTSRAVTSPVPKSAEQLSHITGEVTNPVPLERIFMEDPLVRYAIMFGHGRYNAGFLIELRAGHEIDRNDEKQLEETRKRLDRTIERVNMFAPQQSRVFKEMIIIAPQKKPFLHSARGDLDRAAILLDYKDEINAIYRSMERATKTTFKPPKIWSPENSLAFVRGIIATILGKKINDEVDFFNYGVDSLIATRIRAILFRALESSAKVDIRKFSGTIVHQYNTVSSLAGFATRAARASMRHRTESNLARYLEITKTLKSYSSSFAEHQPSMPPPQDDVVLITGTTGLFGVNLLARFVQDPRVFRIYSLNRKKSRPASLVDRHAILFQASGLDPRLARHRKVTYLEADMTQDNLGLSQEIYEKLRFSATHIVHNAWLSTYEENSPLTIFDGSFRILRNLIDFSLSSPLPDPPRLLFISTTDTLHNNNMVALSSTPRETDAETENNRKTTPVTLKGPVSSLDAVYGESKWIGEQILSAAASNTPLQPIVVRVGQLCGALNGRWREGEYFPMIVKLSVDLAALPQIDEEIHWIPVDIAAEAVAEMRDSSSSQVHIAHPTSISSLSLLHFISDELKLPLIPLSEWTTKLEEKFYAVPYPALGVKVENPALTILRHIRRAKEDATTDGPYRMFKDVNMSSDEAWSASPTLRRGMDALGAGDVQLWLQYWRDTGMISKSES